MEDALMQSEISRVSILKWNDDRAIEKLDKAIRKAKKSGIAALSYSFDAWRSVPRVIELQDGRKKQIWEEFIDVVVTGNLPVFEGWEFLSRIEAVEGGGLLFKNVPGFDGAAEIVKGMTDFDPYHCDHCKTRRQRNETFLVREKETGKIQQIGRNCLKYFIGSTNPSSIINHLKFFDEIRETMDDMDGYGCTYHEPLIEAQFLLEMSFASIRQVGYARDRYSTRDRVMDYWSSHYESRQAALELNRSINEDDKQKTLACMEWLRNHPAQNDYFHNLKVLMGPTFVPKFYRNAGLIISAAQAYLKEMGLVEARKKASESEFVGVVGEKVEMTLTIANRRNLGKFSYYSPDTIMYIMKDDAGNTVIWKSATAFDKQIGDTFKAIAKVKEHKEYTPPYDNAKPQKQTIVLRLKIKE